MFIRIALICGVVLSVASAVAQQKPAQQRPDERAKKDTALEEVVFEIGPGITPPRATSTPDPDYPQSARNRKPPIQGTCVLGVIVDEHGTTRNVHVIRSVNKVLDQSAIDAVKQWKFTPAMKDGKPVAVRTSVEVSFRMY